jgi:cold shock protein
MSQRYSDRMMSADESKTSWPGLSPPTKNTGTVTYWNTEKGFGFARRDDGQPDIFAHINSVIEDTEDLKVGQRVKFNPEISPKSGKLAAQGVTLIKD